MAGRGLPPGPGRHARCTEVPRQTSARGGSMKVLVAGDGAVAQATVTALLEAGHEVRLLSPRATHTARLWPRGVEPWPADLARVRSLEGAADGCGAVLQTGAVREPWQRPAGHAGAPLGVLAETRIDVR